MNLKNRKPVFVPQQYWAEIEQLSKAALMDVAWDLATRASGADVHYQIMAELRSTAAIIQNYRKQEDNQ